MAAATSRLGPISTEAPDAPIHPSKDGAHRLRLSALLREVAADFRHSEGSRRRRHWLLSISIVLGLAYVVGQRLFDCSGRGTYPIPHKAFCPFVFPPANKTMFVGKTTDSIIAVKGSSGLGECRVLIPEGRNPPKAPSSFCRHL